jgi:hypothetical protein
MNIRVDRPRIQSKRSRKPFEIVALCDDEPSRLDGPSADLADGRSALVHFDCAGAIDAAFKGVVDALVVDWSGSSPERLTALSFLRRERPWIRIYFVVHEEGSAPHVELWTPAH